MDEVRRLLDNAILDSREDYQSLSLYVGKNRTYLQQYLKRGLPKFLPIEVATKVCRKLQIEDINQFLRPDVAGSLSIQTEPKTTIKELSLSAVKKQRGRFMFMEKLNDPPYWELPSYITNRIANNTTDLTIVQVEGDSMVPELNPGDRVAINTEKRTPSPPGIFAIHDGLAVTLKRLEHLPNKKIHVSSANPAYESYDLPLSEMNIVGRVVWLAKEI